MYGVSFLYHTWVFIQVLSLHGNSFTQCRDSYIYVCLVQLGEPKTLYDEIAHVELDKQARLQQHMPNSNLSKVIKW